MATLRETQIEIPTANFGPENPHPSLAMDYAFTAQYEGKDLTLSSCLPYRLQDAYDRNIEPKKHKALVLESDRLRATFLPNLGGRLWSLFHKPSNRELLYVNPVLQPVNIAIRGGWCSGGIEWNIGVFGHSVFTNAPLFAARTVAPDGSDGLRFWEYERIRGTPWQVDFWLPDNSDFLYFSPRIQNPHAKAIPMYWWTCIAVPEVKEGRVLAPATHCLEPEFTGSHEYVSKDLAADDGLTTPTRREFPRDTYFDIPESERPWIAHVEPDGRGVLHVSSRKLKGRKQWVWGMGRAGRRWQDWLCPGGPTYIEIQGGLGKRQAEYVKMPANSEWNWLEAFGPVEDIDAKDWKKGVLQVSNHIDSHFKECEFAGTEKALTDAQKSPPKEILNQGSGWGASESSRRKANGDHALCGPELPFPESSIGTVEEPWKDVLEDRTPQWNVTRSPGPYAGAEWQTLVEGLSERYPNAWAFLQLGVAAFQEGDCKAARSEWERSLCAERNGWALRNLALLDRLEGRNEDFGEKLLEALRLLPDDPWLSEEICRTLQRDKDWATLELVFNQLSQDLKSKPRARLAAARVALAKGDTNAARAYFSGPCDLVDIRECELTLSELWEELCRRDPTAGDPDSPPDEFNFRMTAVPEPVAND